MTDNPPPIGSRRLGSFCTVRELFLTLTRLCLAVVVVVALPASHDYLGDTSNVDGQSAFGFAIVGLVVGVFAGMIYFTLASVSQYLLQRAPLSLAVVVEIAWFVVFAGTLCYWGITAEYR